MVPSYKLFRLSIFWSSSFQNFIFSAVQAILLVPERSQWFASGCKLLRGDMSVKALALI